MSSEPRRSGPVGGPRAIVAGHGDFAAGLVTAVEQITGRLVRLGEKLLVSMPRSEAVYGRVKDLEASYLGADAARQATWDELPWETEPF